MNKLRWNWMWNLAMMAGWVCWGMVTHAAEKQAGTGKPNVLFIAVDDLNDWISPLGGYKGIQTPNFDRLAKGSMTFTKAYCAAPACNPSRAALMTGIRPSTSGVYLNSQPWRPAMPKAVTMTQHFMAHGYQALGGGKIFHGGFNDDASWNSYFKQRSDPSPAKKPANGIANTSHFDWGPLTEDDEAMGDWQMVDWAVGELAKPHEQPVFLAAGLYRPHLPWYVPQKYFDQYALKDIVLPQAPADDLNDVPAAGVKMANPNGDHKKVLDSNNWERGVQGYLASIAFADRCLGRLLDALEKSPQGKNTIVVLWGDHGWHLGEKQHWRKFSLWEEADRVPLFIYAPGLTAAGSRCDRTVSLLDLYPTLAELCGLPIPAEVEGKSLVPLLKDPQAAWNRPVITTHGMNNHAVRSERYRYIRYADGSEELYDHDQDPMEWKNLAQLPDLAAVKADLATHLPQTNAPNAASEDNGKKKSNKKKAD